MVSTKCKIVVKTLKQGTSFEEYWYMRFLGLVHIPS